MKRLEFNAVQYGKQDPLSIEELRAILIGLTYQFNEDQTIKPSVCISINEMGPNNYRVEISATQLISRGISGQGPDDTDDKTFTREHVFYVNENWTIGYIGSEFLSGLERCNDFATEDYGF